MVKREGIWKIAHFQNTIVDLEAGEKRSDYVGRDRLPAWRQGV